MDNNGGPYTFEVRAVAVIDGTTYASGWTKAGNQARPYGGIGSPRANATGQVEQVAFSWDAPARNGRNISTRIRIGNGNWQSVGNSGSQTVDARGGQTVRITVETSTGAAEAGHGAQTTTATAEATAEERLNPSITLSRGGPAYPGDCQGNNGETCQWYQLNWTDFRPGIYTFTCHNTGSSNGPNNPFETGRVNITSRNGSTIAEYQGESGDTRTCYSGFAGQAWMHVTGNGIDLNTPRVNWP